MREALAQLPALLAGHLLLVVIALVAGVLVSVPLGVLAHRRPGLERVVLGAAGVLQTIPGLALLAIMVPALGALATLTGLPIPSIGLLPAAIALVLYSALPILRNTVVGLAGVDAAQVEAARAVGMTPWQQLRLVELPLATPVIVAGLRTATVWTVGMATLSTPVGAPSLGNLIFGGLQTRNAPAILTGCAAAACLALGLDALVLGAERLVAARRGRVGLALCAGLLALGLGAAVTRTGPRRPVLVGAKPFTEQYVLAELLALAVRERAGEETATLRSLGSTVAFDALRSGQLDAYVDYSGTLWLSVLRREERPPRDRLLVELGAALEAEHGVLLVGALGFENTYALAMRAADARRLGARRISDLALHAPGLRLGADYEFLQRPVWAALRRDYGLRFAEELTMDPTLLYAAAGQGDVDVVTAYSTDGRIDAFDLTTLEDDRGSIPPYDAVLLVSARLARERPHAVEALRALVGRLDAAAMRRLNAAVDAEGRTAEDVAASAWAELRPGDREVQPR